MCFAMGRARKNRMLRELPEQILKARMHYQWHLLVSRVTEADAYLHVRGASLGVTMTAAQEIAGHIGRFMEFLNAIEKKRARTRLEMLEERAKATHLVTKG